MNGRQVWECIECSKVIISDKPNVRHCGRLMSWLGVADEEVKKSGNIIKVTVSGYMSVLDTELDKLLAKEDPHKGIIDGMKRGVFNMESLEFDIE